MKKFVLVISPLFLVLYILTGSIHRFLPQDMDPCQTELTHAGHVNELPLFHCIGHTEYEPDPEGEGLLRIRKWDHIHPWMTLEWHLEQGFSRAHALRLLSSGTKIL